MAICRSVPRRPMARDAAAMTAGPARKRTPMEMPAARHPQAMRFGCSAINNPGHTPHRHKERERALELVLARSGAAGLGACGRAGTD